MRKAGIGHHKQASFLKTNWQHRYSHGGVLRNQRAGRKARPLSGKDPLHLVFKVNRSRLRHQSLRSSRGLGLTHQIIKKYSVHFAVKVEQLSVQNDHLHLLIRTSRRNRFQNFFRVVAGQMAQRFAKEGLLTGKPPRSRVTDTLASGHGRKAKLGSLWKYRPFTRVVKGYRAYRIVRDYIQLNEKEILGQIRYRKERLRGLSLADWQVLWA